MMNDNIMLLTDSYKASHAQQYPPQTEVVYSYFESRGGEYDDVVFVGLQYLIKRYLQGIVVTEDKIQEAKSYWDQHVGPGIFNEEGWRYILNEHRGWLPIQINAVAEGSVVPVSNVMMTVENTDPNCWWLTNFIETLLVQVWYPSTTATISREMKKIIRAALLKSADNTEGLPFKLHDFGCRGVSSMESASIGGFGHLVNFMGTDTVPALVLASQYYGEDMAGFSIPAAEHSTMTSWGKDREVDAYRNMLEQFPTGIVACVSDSWDIFNACKIWGTKLYDEVMAREGTLVVRPDSGDPILVVPQVLNELGKYFKPTLNEKGYKVLPDQVRVIQGDGITRDSLQGILDAVMNAGWSADNLAFGSGGGLLQTCNRDTQMFAFKCSWAQIDGESVDVFKQPATAAWKNSKAGRLALVNNKGRYGTFREEEMKEEANLLLPVFRDGSLLIEQSLGAIRANAEVLDNV